DLMLTTTGLTFSAISGTSGIKVLPRSVCDALARGCSGEGPASAAVAVSARSSTETMELLLIIAVIGTSFIIGWTWFGSAGTDAADVADRTIARPLAGPNHLCE